jgi:hypothetical protein
MAGDEAYRVTTAEGELVLIECADSRKLSDGYHTMAELYRHRRALTAALCKALSLDSWRSKRHHVGGDEMFPGYFIVGINLPTGPVTYHYKLEHWDDFAGVIELEHAPEWDGAGPDATVDRLLEWSRA